jgi:hypothetical protein
MDYYRVARYQDIENHNDRITGPALLIRALRLWRYDVKPEVKRIEVGHDFLEFRLVADNFDVACLECVALIRAYRARGILGDSCCKS